MILPLLLFVLTVFTVLWAGAYQTNTNPLVGPLAFLLDEPGALWRGLPFAATLLGILVTHEFGHYLFSRIHGVPASCRCSYRACRTSLARSAPSSACARP